MPKPAPETNTRQKMTININKRLAAWLSWQATTDGIGRDELLEEFLHQAHAARAKKDPSIPKIN